VFALALSVDAAGHGACDTATQPDYRAHNDGQGRAPNERNATDRSVLDAMMAQGWIMEGQAATGIFACVPAPQWLYATTPPGLFELRSSNHRFARVATAG